MKNIKYIIVGSMKAGTTALYDFINVLPNAEKSIQKEIHYFSLHYEKSKEWYFSHFPDTNDESFTGEASPTYLDVAYTRQIPKTIKYHLPNIRIIALIRDPVERAISHFNHLKKINKIECLQDMDADEFFSRDLLTSFNKTDEVDMHLSCTLDFSLYYRKLLNFKSVFQDDLLVIKNSDLLKKPNATMMCICKHIEVEYVERPIFNEFKYSSGTNLRQISDETHSKLLDFLTPNYEKSLTLSKKIIC